MEKIFWIPDITIHICEYINEKTIRDIYNLTKFTRNIYKGILKSKKYITVKEYKEKQEKMGDLFNEHLFDNFKIYDNKEIQYIKYATQITFRECFNQSIDMIKWPESLSQIYFGHNFNQPVETVKWPGSLAQIYFGACFNQPVETVKWPESLTHVAFGFCFNQSVKTVKWPKSLTRIYFGHHYNLQVDEIKWPKSLKSIQIGDIIKKID